MPPSRNARRYLSGPGALGFGGYHRQSVETNRQTPFRDDPSDARQGPRRVGSSERYGGRPLKQLCKRVAPLSQLFTFKRRSSFLKNRIHRFDMIFHLMRQSLQAR